MPTPLHRRPELLAPAGTLDMMRTAFAYGADAVYAGQPRYSLRVRNNSFGQLDTLAAGIDEAHAAGKLFYLVANIYPHNAKIRSFEDDMAPVMAMKPDALIMADPGLMMMVRERWPETDIHLSVQANTTNYASVRFWQSMGVKRIILSRELSLDEVAEIRDACPDMELEVFVHGALCIAYSGRCLLSGYFNHRDPNQGSCTNSCRWDYKLHEAAEDAAGDVQACGGAPIGNPKDAGAVGTATRSKLDTVQGLAPGRRAASTSAAKVWLLEEGTRPGELMPIEEDEHGTYILNSKDLRAIEHVRRLVEIGVDSLKIEGRTELLLRRPRGPGLPARDRTRSLAPIRPEPARRARRAGQPRLHRRLLPASFHARAPELPARPLRIGPQPAGGRGGRLGRRTRPGRSRGQERLRRWRPAGVRATGRQS